MSSSTSAVPSHYHEAAQPILLASQAAGNGVPNARSRANFTTALLTHEGRDIGWSRSAEMCLVIPLWLFVSETINIMIRLKRTHMLSDEHAGSDEGYCMMDDRIYSAALTAQTVINLILLLAFVCFSCNRVGAGNTGLRIWSTIFNNAREHAAATTLYALPFLAVVVSDVFIAIQGPDAWWRQFLLDLSCYTLLFLALQQVLPNDAFRVTYVAGTSIFLILDFASTIYDEYTHAQVSLSIQVNRTFEGILVFEVLHLAWHLIKDHRVPAHSDDAQDVV